MVEIVAVYRDPVPHEGRVRDDDGVDEGGLTWEERPVLPDHLLAVGRVEVRIGYRMRARCGRSTWLKGTGFDRARVVGNDGVLRDHQADRDRRGDVVVRRHEPFKMAPLVGIAAPERFPLVVPDGDRHPADGE